MLQDDGSGRQRLRFIPVNGGYNIALPAGREACTQPNFVTAQTCASNNNAVTFAAAGAGLQVRRQMHQGQLLVWQTIKFAYNRT